MNRNLYWIALLLAMAAGQLAFAAPGDKRPAPATASDRGGSKKARLPGVTPAREAAVRTFVREHHPELVELLLVLKESAPQEYAAAIKDLFRTSERLAHLQERDAGRYQLELRRWKARSRVELLAARAQMGFDASARAALRSALAEELAARRALMENERERLLGRVRQLESQIDALSSERQIDRKVESLLENLLSRPTAERSRTKR